MSNTYFQFKKFTVNQDRCAMKVGTDGVLLGAWTDISNVNSILDIGTGTGLIALMLAQRTAAPIHAIEIDDEAAAQAAENVHLSKWHNRITIQNISLQQFAAETNVRFDLIVSNPPYFNNSLKNPDNNRSQARHTEALSYDDLLSCSRQLLGIDGRLSVILPETEGIQFMEKADKTGLYCSRKTNVLPRTGSPAKRLLLEFSRTKNIYREDNLLIETDKRHQYSSDFIALTKDYYLDK